MIKKYTGNDPIQRLPRALKLKIGEKAVNERGVEHPKSTDYFVPFGQYADLFKTKFGDKPREIEIYFISDDIESICHQEYACWKAGGKFCWGDGIEATRANSSEGTSQIPCDLETCNYFQGTSKDKAKCREELTISFIVPGFDVCGVVTFTTHSYQSRNEIFNALALCQATNPTKRISGIPFSLTVEKHKSMLANDQAKVYPLIHLIPKYDVGQIMKLASNEMNPTALYYRLNEQAKETSMIELQPEPHPEPSPKPQKQTKAKEIQPSGETMQSGEIELSFPEIVGIARDTVESMRESGYISESNPDWYEKSMQTIDNAEIQNNRPVLESIISKGQEALKNI